MGNYHEENIAKLYWLLALGSWLLALGCRPSQLIISPAAGNYHRKRPDGEGFLTLVWRSLTLDSTSSRGEQKALLRTVPITSVLLVAILLVGGISRANAAGTTKLSPNMLCITCGPPGHPNPISGTLNGASVSGTVTPSSQTSTLIITPPDGASGYSGVINFANQTVEVWFPNGYEKVTFVQNNGATYAQVYVSVNSSGADAQLAGPQGSNSGGMQPLIQNEPDTTCMVDITMNGMVMAGDLQCMQEVSGLALNYVDSWYNIFTYWFLANQGQLEGCAILAGAVIAAAIGVIIAPAGGWFLAASGVIAAGEVYLDASEVLKNAYDACIPGP